MKKISQDRINNIKKHLLDGLTILEVMKETNESRGTVRRVKETMGLPPSNNKGGKPKVLTEREQKFLVQTITTGGKSNAVEARKELQEQLVKTVSDETVRRSLKASGMVPFVKPKKPLLTSKHRKERLKWAKEHINWTLDDLKKVVWSDETKVNLFGSDGKSYAWKMPGEAAKDHYIRATVKHGGGCLMVRSCITWYGPGWVVDVGHSMDRFVYLSVLQDDLLRTISHYSDENGLPEGHFIFMQDNDPKHKSKVVMEWLRNSEIKVLEWPAQSPDLNPIENVWSLLKYRLFKHYDHPPAGIHELWERTSKVWYEITAEECQKYIKTMHMRCLAVIEANGGYTKY